jgi:hypothetical protein
MFNNIMAVIVLKYKDIIPIKGFNTAYWEKTFQPIWFDIIGIILTIKSLKRLREAKNGA